MRYFLYAARAARFLYIIIVLKNAKSLSGHSAAGLLYGTRFPIDCAVPYRVLGFYTERGFLYAARSDRSLRADRIRAGRTRSASIKGSGSAWAAGAAWTVGQCGRRGKGRNDMMTATVFAYGSPSARPPPVRNAAENTAVLRI